MEQVIFDPITGKPKRNILSQEGERNKPLMGKRNGMNKHFMLTQKLKSNIVNTAFSGQHSV
jgi:hypothetical protein